MFAPSEADRQAESLARRLIGPALVAAALAMTAVAAALVVVASPLDPGVSPQSAQAPGTNRAGVQLPGGETVFVATAAPTRRPRPAPAPATVVAAPAEQADPSPPPAPLAAAADRTSLDPRTGGTTWLMPRGAAPALGGGIAGTAGDASPAPEPRPARAPAPVDPAPRAIVPAPEPEPVDTGSASSAAFAFAAASRSRDTPAIPAPPVSAMQDDTSALDGPDVALEKARVTSDVNMRAGPDNGEPVVTVVPAGGEVEVIACAMWCEVMRGDEHGWIFRDFVDRSGGEVSRVGLPPA